MGDVVEIDGKYYVRKGGEYLGIPGHYSSDRLVEIERIDLPSADQIEERKRQGSEDDKFFFKVMVPIFVGFWFLVMWGLYWR